jgi:putative SOS response-associated peptidase YedK
MCARFTLSQADKDIMAAYAAKLANPFTPKQHIAITDTSLVITADQPDELQPMHFSIVPHIAKNKKEFVKYSLFNSKSEEIMTKRLFRPLLVNHKTCLIPADGFIEWQTNGSNKDPFHIHLVDRDIFSFAGIWSRWVDPATKEPYNSFAIMTTSANPLVAWIHNTKFRMPVILPKEDEKLWLDKELAPADLLSLCKPYPAELMDARVLSQRVNIERTDDGRLVYPQNSL